MSADLPPSTSSTRRKTPRVVEQQSSSVLSPGFTPWHRNVPSSAVDSPAPVPQPSTSQRQPPSQSTLLPPSITSPSDYISPATRENFSNSSLASGTRPNRTDLSSNVSTALSEAPVSIAGTASAASASAGVSAGASASMSASMITSTIVSASAIASAPTSTTTMALDVDPHKYLGIPTIQDASNINANLDMNVADINTSEHIRRLTSGNSNSPIVQGPPADNADPADDPGEGETNGAEQQAVEVNNEEAAVDDKVEKDKIKLEDKREREEFLKEQKRLEEEDKAKLDTCRRYFMFGCCGLPLLHFFTVIYFYPEWNGETRNFHIQRYISLCLIVGVVQLFLWIIWFLIFQINELKYLSILKTDFSVVGNLV